MEALAHTSLSYLKTPRGPRRVNRGDRTLSENKGTSRDKFLLPSLNFVSFLLKGCSPILSDVFFPTESRGVNVPCSQTLQ